jgi:hypothetical protein
MKAKRNRLPRARAGKPLSARRRQKATLTIGPRRQPHAIPLTRFCTAPLPVLRDRTRAAIAGDRWVTDGNKSAVRDLVWPRADTVIWLDYPLVVCLWRLARRALWRTSVIKAQAAETDGKAGLLRQFLLAAKGVLTALRSHKGQRREYPEMFARQENQHLAVVRLRSPRATRRWLAHVARPNLPSTGC